MQNCLHYVNNFTFFFNLVFTFQLIKYMIALAKNYFNKTTNPSVCKFNLKLSSFYFKEYQKITFNSIEYVFIM